MGCTLCTFQTCFFDHKMTETGMRQHKEGVRLKGEKEIQTERERKRMTRHKQRGIEARKILRNRETRVKRRWREWDWERFSKKREWEIEKMRERSGIWSQTSPELRLYSSVKEKRAKHHFTRTLQTDKKDWNCRTSKTFNLRSCRFFGCSFKKHARVISRQSWFITSWFGFVSKRSRPGELDFLVKTTTIWN